MFLFVKKRLFKDPSPPPPPFFDAIEIIDIVWQLKGRRNSSWQVDGGTQSEEIQHLEIKDFTQRYLYAKLRQENYQSDTFIDIRDERLQLIVEAPWANTI